MSNEIAIPSTITLNLHEGEHRYGLSLAPNSALPAGTGTWNPCASFPILLSWMPADTPAVHVEPPPATAGDKVAGPSLPPPIPDPEQQGWLKVAESAFAFWDNPDDDGWDQL